MTRTLMTLGMLLLAGSATRANPSIDETKAGLCVELKVDGQTRPCNGDFRLVDDGEGEVSFVTGYGEARTGKTVVAFFTTQTPDMENAYGYALRIGSVNLMPVGAPDKQRIWPASGLCFMVKPNPVRAGASAIRQDVVVMCTANLTDKAATVRKIDWKFVF